MVCVVGAVALLTACAGTDDPPAPTTSAAPLTATSAPAAAPPPAERAKSWFDLDVGDCIAAVPAVDLGEVITTVVDCASPHQAEVYLRAPTAVNTAIADVAHQVCTDGLPIYRGSAAAGGGFVSTYLIDSTQDRTDDNPLPSTIICLLQATGGGALTGSARER